MYRTRSAPFASGTTVAYTVLLPSHTGFREWRVRERPGKIVEDQACEPTCQFSIQKKFGCGIPYRNIRGGNAMRISMIRSIRYLVLLFAALVVPILAMPTTSLAQFSVSVSFAPPELPVYEQPICPGDGYIWTPGYWAWDGDDYYWVPGTWVLAPQPGYLWTPAYWGWNGGDYIFYPGYWGPQVGFYGGIDYGYGYGGHGYDGGRWDNGHFFYNRAVNNVNVTVVHNVYETKVADDNRNAPRVSYNGGNGGVNARPTSQEQAATRERHVAPVAAQN